MAKIDNALRLTAVDDAAARLGIRRGLPLTSARAIHPDLKVVEADPAADQALLEAIADWCDRYTPFVAIEPPDGLLLDMSGGAHLFDGEEALIADITQAMARRGFTAAVALAGSIGAARALARYRPGTIVPAGTEAQAVAPLPAAALGLPADVAQAIRRAGLATVADLADRPRAIFSSRFGALVGTALDRLRGVGDVPLSPRRPPPCFRIGQRFAEPVADAAIIAATIAGLARDLGVHLERAGQGARRVEAAFFRSDGALTRLSADTSRPTRDAAVIARLLHERLEALADPLDPGFGFDLIRLAALVVEPLDTAAGAFGGGAEAERSFTALIDRLGARFGTRRIVRFLPGDTHVPEATALPVPAIDVGRAAVRLTPGATAAWQAMRGATEPPARPLRLFDPPHPIQAQPRPGLGSHPDGPPARFRWRRCLHEVVKAEGPERIALDWWRTAGRLPFRDYFRVEDEAGHRFWLFREGCDDPAGPESGGRRWFLHGLFG
ncbi:Y-family DNA polymerase [Chelatococcus reniformis]|uniref:Y-family DNA polymerase n=1 Tax=Chelatococcus reniformis TaxID=1494448 RepID=UPI001FCEC688|nr:DNA polymerase Y family protein [Chelatococcus reniformis]